ncbi:hypothetical protein RFI_28312, partial [Reticulomyxa filosa]
MNGAEISSSNNISNGNGNNNNNNNDKKIRASPSSLIVTNKSNVALHTYQPASLPSSLRASETNERIPATVGAPIAMASGPMLMHSEKPKKGITMNGRTSTSLSSSSSSSSSSSLSSSPSPNKNEGDTVHDDNNNNDNNNNNNNNNKNEDEDEEGDIMGMVYTVAVNSKKQDNSNSMVISRKLSQSKTRPALEVDSRSNGGHYDEEDDNDDDNDDSDAKVEHVHTKNQKQKDLYQRQRRHRRRLGPPRHFAAAQIRPQKKNRPLTITFHKPSVVYPRSFFSDEDNNNNNNNDSKKVISSAFASASAVATVVPPHSHHNFNPSQKCTHVNCQKKPVSSTTTDSQVQVTKQVPSPDTLLATIIRNSNEDGKKHQSLEELKLLYDEKLKVVHQHYRQLYHIHADTLSFQTILHDAVTDKAQQLAALCKENLLLMAKLTLCEQMTHSLQLHCFQ